MVLACFDVIAGFIQSWCVIINNMPHQTYYTNYN